MRHGGKGDKHRCCVPWHKPWAGSAWLGCSVSPLCTRSQERNPEPSSGILHLSVGKKPKKGYYSHYLLLCAISMCTIYQHVHSFPQERFFFFYFCTVSPLCRIPLLKTGSTTTCIINGLCSNCSRRQWYHLLISWLDEACQWAGSTLQHTDPERMPCLLASPPNYSRTSFDSERAASPDSSAASCELAVWGLWISHTAG